MQTMDVSDRFWSHVQKTKTCWLWMGATRSGGYGVFRVRSQSVAAHRLAWEWAHGPIPAVAPQDPMSHETYRVAHTCGNPGCVRPEHLYLLPPTAQPVPRNRAAPSPSLLRAEEAEPAQILAVEDSDGNRRVLEAVLTGDGYSVHTAANGQEALLQLTLQPPDLVIMDFLLPDMSGAELMERLRDQGCTAPVLLVSGNVSPEARRMSQRADAYLMKPYDIDALLQAVADLLGGAVGPQRVGLARGAMPSTGSLPHLYLEDHARDPQAHWAR